MLKSSLKLVIEKMRKAPSDGTHLKFGFFNRSSRFVAEWIESFDITRIDAIEETKDGLGRASVGSVGGSSRYGGGPGRFGFGSGRDGGGSGRYGGRSGGGSVSSGGGSARSSGGSIGNSGRYGGSSGRYGGGSGGGSVGSGGGSIRSGCGSGGGSGVRVTVTNHSVSSGDSADRFTGGSTDGSTDGLTRACEIIELGKLTIEVDSDDEVTTKLRKFLKFYLDVEIKNEYIFQQPAELDEAQLGYNQISAFSEFIIKDMIEPK